MRPGNSDKNLSDLTLLDEMRKGRTRAFDRIFCDHYPNLCRYAYSLVHDEDMSHSLVQAVFVKLWESRESLGHVENLTAYLTTMVRNHCINFLNREKKLTKPGKLPYDTHQDNGTENLILKNDFEEKMIVAVTSLPGRCRTAFELSRFDNLSNKEIATRMGISVKGVEALIGRALKFLRANLSEYLPGNNEPKERKKMGAKTQIAQKNKES